MEAALGREPLRALELGARSLRLAREQEDAVARPARARLDVAIAAALGVADRLLVELAQRPRLAGLAIVEEPEQADRRALPARPDAVVELALAERERRARLTEVPREVEEDAAGAVAPRRHDRVAGLLGDRPEPLHQLGGGAQAAAALRRAEDHLAADRLGDARGIAVLQRREQRARLEVGAVDRVDHREAVRARLEKILARERLARDLLHVAWTEAGAAQRDPQAVPHERAQAAAGRRRQRGADVREQLAQHRHARVELAGD